MSGIPKFNIPAFDKAASKLRADGHIVFSPAELDDPETRAVALASPDGNDHVNGQSWGDFLARDVKLIADTAVEAIVVLPGWVLSRGAKLEVWTGLLCSLHIYTYNVRKGIGSDITGIAGEMMLPYVYDLRPNAAAAA